MPRGALALGCPGGAPGLNLHLPRTIATDSPRRLLHCASSHSPLYTLHPSIYTPNPATGREAAPEKGPVRDWFRYVSHTLPCPAFWQAQNCAQYCVQMLVLLYSEAHRTVVELTAVGPVGLAAPRAGGRYRGIGVGEQGCKGHKEAVEYFIPHVLRPGLTQ